jgi:hypothetical protein
MIFRAFLILGKCNFLSWEPIFASIYSREITQPLKFQWREIKISYVEWFFSTDNTNTNTNTNNLLPQQNSRTVER